MKKLDHFTKLKLVQPKIMPKKADLSAKRLIGLAPQNWAKWVTAKSDFTVSKVFSSEFQWISRQGDVLIRAYNPEFGDFLIVNEVQLRYSNKIPRRMRCYASLAEEKYELPTYPVLINILPNSAKDPEIPTTFSSNLGGLRAIQDYRVINLWEVDVNIAFEQDLLTLLPFVPILKGGEDESTIRQALSIIRRNEDLNELETVLAFFATFVLKSSVVRQIMRWDMAVLHESPWYQEILTEGEVRGEARGRLSSIETVLIAKFGALGLELMSQISPLSTLEQLDALLRHIALTNSLEEIRQFVLESREQG